MQQPPDPFAQTAIQQPQPQRLPGQQQLPSDFMTVLIFAALTLLFAPIFAPITWWLASRELRRIEVGIAASEHITELKIFRIVGIVMTVLMIGAIVISLFFVVLTGLLAAGLSTRT